MAVPKLRFKEFKDNWNNTIIEDIITNKTNTYNPYKSKEDYKCIELEHMEQISGKINGYVKSSEQKSNKSMFYINDVLFGKLRPYLKKYWIATFNGVCSSEIWVLKTKDKRILLNDFLFYLIQQHYFMQLCSLSTGSKMPRADWSFIKEQNILIPRIEEQRNIAKLLSKLDRKIELQKQKIEALKLYSESIKNNIFKEKIKVEQDNNCWNTFKLEEILFKMNTRNKDNKIQYVESVNNKKGFISQSEQFEDRNVASIDKSNYYVIKKDTFAYNPSRLDVGSLALKRDDNISVVSPLYECFTTQQNNIFMLNWFKSNLFKSQTLSRFEGGVRNTLTFTNLCTMKIKIPNLEIQERIAFIFDTFEKKINTETKKLEDLTNIKKGLMQRLFV